MFLFKNVTTVKNNQERDNQYSDMFGWHKNPNENKRPDIRDNTTAWMTLLYKIGSVLLQACIVEKPVYYVHSPAYLMTFNPYARGGEGEIYRTSREVGHYWSQMTSVHEYAIVFERLNESAHCNSALDNILYIDTVIHGVCFDFTAWASQYLGHYRKTSTRENENLLRQELIKEINSINISHHPPILRLQYISPPILTIHLITMEIMVFGSKRIDDGVIIKNMNLILIVAQMNLVSKKLHYTTNGLPILYHMK